MIIVSSFKWIFLMLMIAGSTEMFAQKASGEDLYGDWLCKTVTVSSADKLGPEHEQAIEIMKNGITNAVFSFREDGMFYVKWPANAPEIVEELNFINNRKWSFDVSSQVISIGTQSQNLMKIRVQRENHFHILETPLLLQMEKM